MAHTLFHQTCLGDKQSRAPIWLMRQAGRYLPEYRALRAQEHNFMDFCLTPHMVTEATLQPISRFQFDAAIIFSDILVIPHALGQKVWFEQGYGPRLAPQLAFHDWASNWQESLSPIYDAIAKTRHLLSVDRSLIGFAAAPWTLSAYMVCQNKIESHETLYAAINQTDHFEELLYNLVPCITQHLVQQVHAGCDVVQLFDSWAFYSLKQDEKRYIIEPVRAILKDFWSLYPDIPVIYYGRQNTHCYKDIAVGATGPLVFGYDQSVDLASQIMLDHPSQGNLDPDILIQGGVALADAIDRILDATKNRAHIFNLGHGIKPETPIKHVEDMLDHIRSY